jgi:hypothetical protein
LSPQAGKKHQNVFLIGIQNNAIKRVRIANNAMYRSQIMLNPDELAAPEHLWRAIGADAMTARVDVAQWLREVHGSTRFLHDLLARAKAATAYPDLLTESRPTVDTATAAHWLSRRPQTMRIWACRDNGPIRPIRVQGRLAWPVAELRRVLGVSK